MSAKQEAFTKTKLIFILNHKVIDALPKFKFSFMSPLFERPLEFKGGTKLSRSQKIVKY